MAEITSVCVYCGSSMGSDPRHRKAAEELGALLAREGIRLVYGGGSIGLMGVLARSVLSGGGKVLGIIPQFLKDREIMLAEVSELKITADMHERKRAMFEAADAFVALPGGIGTLEEIVEMMTWAQLKRHQKPVMLANIGGFWDPLVDLLAHMSIEGFLSKEIFPGGGALAYSVVASVDQIIPKLREAAAPLSQAALSGGNGAKLM